MYAPHYTQVVISTFVRSPSHDISLCKNLCCFSNTEKEKVCNMDACTMWDAVDVDSILPYEAHISLKNSN